MALGHQDYGLYGVVGGLTFFITFLNNLSATAISRFYAVEVGRASVAEDKEEGLENCRRWFNTAVMIHTILPIACVSIGYPIGIWMIENWLEIPPDRIEACVWVFRFVCLSCLVGMVNVPFQAMYFAKQYIAELTIYGLASSTVQACFLYYIASHPSDWLVRYSAWICVITIVPQMVICLRAMRIFPECRINIRQALDYLRFKKLISYAGWYTFGSLGGVIRTQGIAILINKYFGAKVNAAMSVANTINGHAGSLSSAMLGAFTPAISNACGAGDDELVRRMAFRACKFGMLLVMIFALPLSVEINNVMSLWLKSPPQYSAGLCLCMIAMLIIDKSAIGHMCAVDAKGKIACYQFVVGSIHMLTLPLACMFVILGCHVYYVGIALVIMTAVAAFGRACFARKLVGMGLGHWIFKIILPVVFVGLISLIICAIPCQILKPTFFRVCLTVVIAEMVLIPLAWLFVLDKNEREYVSNGVRNAVERLTRNF